MRFQTLEKQVEVEKNLFFDVSLLTCDILISISATHSGTALNGNCSTWSLQHAGIPAGRIPQGWETWEMLVRLVDFRQNCYKPATGGFPIVICLFYLQFPQDPRG